MYQGFSLKFLKRKISQILFSVTKLIGLPEQLFHFNRKQWKYKNLRYSCQEKTSDKVCAKCYATGTIYKGIETL